MCDLTQLGIFNVLANEKALSQVAHVSSFKSESLRGAARDIRAEKLRDGRPTYHLATARCRVDITAAKVPFLRVFTSFFAHFPREKCTPTSINFRRSTFSSFT
jgi:hypothetical protein